jgi:predicted PurR-regulated permease PerM
MDNKQSKQVINQQNSTITLKIQKNRGSSSGGLIFLLILIILLVFVYLYHNQILGYLENNTIFQNIKNSTMQFINESQQAYNSVQNALNGNINLNNTYTSSNQNNTNTSS